MSKRRTRLRSDCSIIMIVVSAIVSSLTVLAYDCLKTKNCMRPIETENKSVVIVKEMVI